MGFIHDPSQPPGWNFDQIQIALQELRLPVIKSGSSLGASRDGQTAAYVADATNGVLWTFRYNAGSASSYKWEFAGGSPLTAATSVDETGAGSALAATYTTVQTVTVPLAGDYAIEFMATMQALPGTTAAYAAVHKNGTIVPALTRYHNGGTREWTVGSPPAQTLAAGDVLTLKLKTDVANAAALYWSTALRARPVRVS